MKRILFTTIFFFALAVSLMNANASEEAELHWSVCEESPELVLKKLGLQVKDFDHRKVSYHDTWNTESEDFENYAQGVVLRVRHFEEGAKSTVKVKFDSFPELSDEWEEHKGFKCEKDLYLNRESFYCSLSEDIAGFSALQKKFLRDLSFDVQWSKLVEHGPAANRVWSLKAQGQIPKLGLEELSLKDQTTILELSTKTTVSVADAEHRRLSAWFLSKTLNVCDLQESKTRQFLTSYKSSYVQELL